ncbi:OmpA family protein, partial [Opitutales bacterium]|nr:OmpA family protein [Opitutales bacterium]
IEGYCDYYGTEDYNLALGDRRANSARDYLATLGADTNTVDTLSKGGLEATAGISKSESGKDRRVELIILK